MRLHYDAIAWGGQEAASFSPGLAIKTPTDPLTNACTHARTHARSLARTYAHSHRKALTHLGNWEIDLETGLASPDDNNPDNELMMHEMLAAFVRLAAARYNDKARAVTKASAPKPLASQTRAPFPRLADKTEELLRAFVLPLEK